MRETQGIGSVDAATPAAVPMTVRRLILRDMVLASPLSYECNAPVVSQQVYRLPGNSSFFPGKS
jgi:hypothetical protein